MKVIPFLYKDFDDLCANTYLVIDSLNQCVVIDPSKKYDGIVNYIKTNNLTLKGILLTHSHADHFRGVESLLDSFNVPVYIGFYDEPALSDPMLNCSFMFENKVVLKRKVETLSDNQSLDLLEEKIDVIETPYHTIGSVCYYFKESKLLFSGDSLFYNSIGRYDLPTSDRSKIESSLEKILSLPEDVRVYPGHGLFTKIKVEKEFHGK